MDTVDSLLKDLEKYNAAYRAGHPMIDDKTYDHLVEKLRGMAPDHPYLSKVEPERFSGKREIRHPSPMLSTEKAYTQAQLARYIERVEKAAAEIGIRNLIFRITPKLDGLAGRDDGDIFVSRGNGHVGYEISSAFEKGVVPVEGRGLGLGEIVITLSYFNAHLSDKFVHPRNLVVGIVSSDTLNPDAKKALNAGAVRFVPYETLPRREEKGEILIREIADITGELTDNLDYPVDGMIVEAVDAGLKAHMGATTHHYRWQIAVKTKGETRNTTVKDIIWQVGRRGKVTPVLSVQPIRLSGADIRRVTGHHAGNIVKLGIGPGAEIEIIRSGEVIPKIEKVLKPSQEVVLPGTCPSCDTVLIWQNDFLLCINLKCQAQIRQAVSHWFKTLGNADWFGIKTAARLVDSGFDTLEKIYAMSLSDFTGIGFGPVQSRNLFEALALSRSRPIEDWRFLAAFGISDLGVGDSRRLLRYVRIEDVTTLTAESIENIHGFGKVTGKAVEKDIQKLTPTIRHMLNLGFQLIKTALASEADVRQSPISGNKIVFTGKMTQRRNAMQNEAGMLGAEVQTAVSGKTDLLVLGENVGRKKIEKAERLGVKTLTETEYRNLIKKE